MSDEYSQQGSGFGNSLVDNSLDKRDTENNPTPSLATGNYPPHDDTTSSGGYGANASGSAFSNRNQRGAEDLPKERGIYSDASSAQQPGGFQPASETSNTFEGTASGDSERRGIDVTETGGAARAAGTFNDVGA